MFFFPIDVCATAWISCVFYVDWSLVIFLFIIVIASTRSGCLTKESEKERRWSGISLVGFVFSLLISMVLYHVASSLFPPLM